MLRVLTLSLALATPLLARAEPADVTSGSTTLSTEGHAFAPANSGARFPTIAPSVACYAPDGRVVTPTVNGCPGFDAQPMAIDDPDLSPAYFGGTADVATSHQSLLADLARYKGDHVDLYLSSGRSLTGTLTDVSQNQVGFRLANGTRLKIDPGRIEGFGEMGE